LLKNGFLKNCFRLTWPAATAPPMNMQSSNCCYNSMLCAGGL
jgi:hypothetical protein